MTYIHSKENLMLWQVCPASLHFLTGRFCIVVEGEGFISLTDNPTYRLHTRSKKGRLPQDTLEKNVATFLAYVILFPTVTFYLPMPALCKGEAVEDLAALFSAVALRPELYPNLRIPAEFVPYFYQIRELKYPKPDSKIKYYLQVLAKLSEVGPDGLTPEEEKFLALHSEIIDAPSDHAAILWQEFKSLLSILDASDTDTKDYITRKFKLIVHEPRK